MPPKTQTQPKAGALAATALAAPAGAAVDGAAVTLSAADAAAAVKRIVPAMDEAGKPTGEMEEVAVDEAEILAWAVRGETVTVVTTDGQKLVGAL